MTTMTKTLAIKAGSSIFQDESCFETVADMLIPITEQVDQLFFVVSALKGETDRTIEEIAGEEFDVLNSALKGEIFPAKKYNTTEIAQQLVAPENYSVRQLTAALQRRDIAARGLQHGREYPLMSAESSNYLYAIPNIRLSQAEMPRYKEQVVVVPGFGLRSPRDEVLCMGRGSSDLTNALIGTAHPGMREIIYWKDTGGYLKDPEKPGEGIYHEIAREQVLLKKAKVLDPRVFTLYEGTIRITSAGMLTGGTVIPPYREGIFDK